MSLQSEFESKVTRLSKDARIVRIHDWADTRFFLQRKELNFNAMVFSRPLSEDEKKLAELYVKDAQPNVSHKNNGVRYRTYEIKAHFDKARRRTIPPNMRSLPMSPFTPDYISSYLRMEEERIPELLQDLFIDLTQDSYDLFLPADMQAVAAMQNNLKERETLDNGDLYEPYSAFLRTNSSAKSEVHKHGSTLIYAMMGEGTICYEGKNGAPTYQTQEGEILLHDETMHHSAPSYVQKDRLTYITGVGW